MKIRTFFAISSLTLFSATAFAGNTSHGGFSLTDNYAFEHRYMHFDTPMTVAVDPVACIEFGLGSSKQITTTINGTKVPLSVNTYNIEGTAGYAGCMLAVRVGQILRDILFPGAEYYNDSSAEYRKISGTSLEVLPYVFQATDLKSNIDVPMFIKYKENGAPKTLYFPLAACVNPRDTGNVLVDNGTDKTEFDVKTATHDRQLSQVIIRACASMVAIYPLIKETPALQPEARKLVPQLYPN